MEENKIKVDYTTDQEKNNLSDTSSIPSSEIKKYLIWKPTIVSLFFGILLDLLFFPSIFYSMLLPLCVCLYTYTIYKLELKSKSHIIFFSIIFSFLFLIFSSYLFSIILLARDTHIHEFGALIAITFGFPLFIIFGYLLGSYINHEIKKRNLFPEKDYKALESVSVFRILSVIAILVLLIFIFMLNRNN